MPQADFVILSIDDDEADQRILRRCFSRITGWTVEVVECETPQTAVLALRSRKFDVVLLDHQLGRHTGLALLDPLIEAANNPFLPVIMVTGRGDEVLAVEAIKSGAVDYIPKKYLSPATLRSAVQNAVTKAMMREELARQRVQLERLARVDDLTGLLNRRSFDEILRVESHRSKRFGLPLCLAMIDLDNFKQVNDTYGHVAGDEVIRRTGETIANTTRATDSACRWGGEEFAVVLSGVQIRGALVFAERVLEQLRAEVYIDRNGKRFQVTASIGLAGFDAKTQETARLVDAADRALYAAKQAGRDRVWA